MVLLCLLFQSLGGVFVPLFRLDVISSGAPPGVMKRSQSTLSRRLGSASVV